MRHVHKILSIVIVLTLTFPQVFASDGLWSKDLDAILNKNGLNNNQYGIEIRDTNGKVYYSANSKQAFNPASTMKLLVSIVALDKFGPQYKFHTLLKKQRKDVCIVGQGDPSFVYEDMYLMVEEALRSPELKDNTIENIIVDESFFPTTKQYDGDFDDDAQRSFTAPLSSLSLNYNSVSIFVKPSAVGSKPFVYTEPRSGYFSIRNNARTSNGGEKTINATVDANSDKVVITIAGQIPITSKETIIYRAMTDPSNYAGNILKDMFNRAGVAVTGTILKRACASDAETIADFDSKPLSQIVMGMNKFSNNFIAETLLYHLGEPRNSQSGMNEMLTWAKKKNLPMDQVKITNASGLSRDNALTPVFLWELFSYGRNIFQISPELMASLPIGGMDGTLRRRFHGSDTESLIRAKSGSLKNTVSLVGSIQTPKKGELLFVFLFETKGKTTGQIQSIEERLLEKVAALGKN